MEQKPTHISLSRTSLFSALTLALVLGGLLFYWFAQPTPGTAPAVIAQTPPLVATPPVVVASSVPALEKPTLKPTPIKPPTPASKATPSRDEFVIQGLLSTGGEPWAANMIMVKILWLKNKDNKQFLLGKETSMAQATPNGFAYRITLKPQTSEFLNWNGGVEGNVGRIVAFVDNKRDGRLSASKDRIIAVSKELIRYRTGRFDKNILNDIQQQNIRQAGRGYAIVGNSDVAGDKTDWQVVASQSPARLDLSAAETSLPHMYNAFLKLH